LAPESERPISRISLRKILLEGLEGVVAFDKTFVAYEATFDGRVSVGFKDGSTATGDLVVGADGASSHVRAQLLPEARRQATGIVGLCGKFSLDDAAGWETHAAVLRGQPWSWGRKAASSLRARSSIPRTPRAPTIAMNT